MRAYKFSQRFVSDRSAFEPPSTARVIDIEKGGREKGRWDWGDERDAFLRPLAPAKFRLAETHGVTKSGAPGVRERIPIPKKICFSVHPRDFSDHVTVRPLVCRTTAKLMWNVKLSSECGRLWLLFNLMIDIHIIVNWQLIRVTWPYRGLRRQFIEVTFFPLTSY